MADRYTQLYIHVTFAVKGRQCLLAKAWRDKVFAYIIGIVNNKKQALITINGVEDHIHFLVVVKPTVLLSELVRDVKANSSRFINENNWVKGRFEWQEGYAAFSVGHAELGRIVNYIRQQEAHHKVKTFKEEYLSFLAENGVTYKPEYVFEKDSAAPPGLSRILIVFLKKCRSSGAQLLTNRCAKRYCLSGALCR